MRVCMDHRRFSIVVCVAWRATFESASQWGYRNFFSVDDVRDRDSGYLLGDSIVVVIRLRQCTVETESLSVVPMQNAFTYTVTPTPSETREILMRTSGRCDM